MQLLPNSAHLPKVDALIFCLQNSTWRSGRVVDCTCLENRSLSNRTVSSNLTSSANNKNEHTKVCHFYLVEESKANCLACGEIRWSELCFGSNQNEREADCEKLLRRQKFTCRRISPPPQNNEPVAMQRVIYSRIIPHGVSLGM